MLEGSIMEGWALESRTAWRSAASAGGSTVRPRLRGFGFRAESFEGLGFRVEGFGFRVEGLGLRVSGV